MDEKQMTKDERCLLLFFEYVAVDQWGWVDDTRKMNNEDVEIADRWNRTGYVLFKRASRQNPRVLGDIQLTYVVKLSYQAWRDAHELRKAKALRHIPEPFLEGE